MAVNLVWFRNDLRVDDNPALWHGADKADAVFALFILTPKQWRSHDMAGCRVEFLLAALASLRSDLAKSGIPLQVIAGEDFAGVPDLILGFCRAHKIDGIFWNNEYPVDEVRRDTATAELLSENGVRVSHFHDRVLSPPETVLTQQGEPYKVFTPFRKNLLAQLHQGLPNLFPPPGKRTARQITLNDIPRSLPGFKSRIDSGLWPAGEKQARQRLENFIDQGLENYKDARDFPAADGTSTLSPYLAVGNLSPQQCLLGALSGPRSEGADSWISEIIWREFYQYIAWHFPRVCKYKPFKTDTGNIPWRDSNAEFEAWASGKTGVPLVDAGMRQLLETGWMHNRVRMVTAMFFSKNLLLDWRQGERFFMQHLIDGDFPANNGGWQWSASTGTDAAPYFRVFNPVTQGARFDPGADYIKFWVPELRDMSAREIHSPAGLQKYKPDSYPGIIVDLKASRERAIAAFKK